MAIWDPMVQAECDKCGFVSDPMEMTSLAGGGWDTRNIPARMKREGWVIDGDTTICADCAEESDDG